METQHGSISNILRNTFGQYYPDHIEAKVREEEKKREELKLKQEQELQVEIETKTVEKGKNVKPPSARPPSSKKKGGKPDPKAKKEEPIAEPPKIEEPIKEDPKLQFTRSGPIPLDNNQLSTIEFDYTSRKNELDLIMDTLQTRYDKAQKFDEDYTNNLSQQGIKVNVDMPRIENPYYNIPNNLDGSNSIIGKQLVDDYQYQFKKRSGFIPSEGKEYNEINDIKHYLQTTQANQNRCKNINKVQRAPKSADSVIKKPTNFKSTIDPNTIDENNRIFDSMYNKLHYVENPRYSDISLSLANQRKMLALSKQFLSSPKPYFDRNETGFVAFPPELFFENYDESKQYEQLLELVNCDKITHRISILPPKTDYFCLHKVQYPDHAKGDVAPGLSCRIYVRFLAEEVRDYDDEIVVVSGQNQFIVKLIARIRRPNLVFDKLVDFSTRLKGSKTKKNLRMKNIGLKSTFYINMFEDEISGRINDKSEIPEYFIEPTEFTLDTNEFIDIGISYFPLIQIKRNIKLEVTCTHYLSWYFEIKGNCEDIDVEWDRIDNVNSVNDILSKVNHVFGGNIIHDVNKNSSDMGIEKIVNNIDEKDDDNHKETLIDKNLIKDITSDIMNNNYMMIDSISFESTVHNTQTKKISIKNGNSFSYPFEFIFYNHNNVIIDNPQILSIQPQSGNLKSHDITEFTVTYTPNLVGQYFYNIGFHLKDIPLLSYPNNNYFSISFPADKVIDDFSPEFINVKHLNFNIFCNSLPCPINLSKNILYFYNMIPLQTYTRTIQLINHSPTRTVFNWIDVPLYLDINPLCGVIEPNSNSDIVITWKPQLSQLPNDNINVFNIIQSNPKCIANDTDYIINLAIIGYIYYLDIIIKESEINFGISECNIKKIRTVNINNQSPLHIDLNCLVDQSTKNIYYDNKDNINDLDKYDVQHTYIDIAPKNIHINPNSSTQLSVSLFPGLCKEFYNIKIKLESNLIKTRYINIYADIQSTEVYITKSIFELHNIYLNIEYSGTFTMINNSLVDTNYKFNSFLEQDSDVLFFLQPNHGTIRSKENITINYRIIPKITGHIEKYYSLIIAGQLLPIGMKILGFCHPLTIGYEIYNELPKSFTDNIPQDSLLPPKFDEIHFGNHEINSCSKLYFILSNYSSITSKYNLKFELYDYNSYFEKQKLNNNSIQNFNSTPNYTQINNQNNRKIKEHSSHLGIIQSLSKTTKNNNHLILHNDADNDMNNMTYSDNNYILSDKHESTQYFSSQSGKEIIKKKQYENYIKESLSSGRGIAFRCDKPSGVLYPWKSIVIELLLFSDLPGYYTDHLIVNIDGLNDLIFNIDATIYGSPIYISTHCVGLNINENPYLLSFPSLLCNTDIVSKTFVVVNRSPRNIMINWELQNTMALDLPFYNVDFEPYQIDNIDGHGCDNTLVDNNSIDNKDKHTHNSYQLNFKENIRRYDESPFYIEPNNIVIVAHKKQEFFVRYKPPNNICTAKSKLIAHCGWINTDDIKSKRKVPLIDKWLELNVKANVKNPIVNLSLKKISLNNYQLNYKVWNTSSINTPTFKKVFTIKNEMDIDLDFSPIIVGPFDIDKRKTQYKILAYKSIDICMVYKPGKDLRIPRITNNIVNMNEANANNSDNNPVLSFNNEGNLVCKFINDFSVDILLVATEMCPHLIIDQTDIDFNRIYIKNYKVMDFYLMNPTEVNADFTIEHIQTNSNNDNPKVFNFSIINGTVNGPTYSFDTVKGHLPVAYQNNEKLPLKISVKFIPELNVQYSSQYKLQIHQGSSYIITLKGSGSYDEQYK